MPNSNRKHKIINFAVGRGLAPAVFCDTLTFFVSSGRGEFNERLPFEVAKRHEGLRKQLSVVFSPSVTEPQRDASALKQGVMRVECTEASRTTMFQEERSRRT